MPSFDDSTWMRSTAGSFYPLDHNRYYRFSTTLPQKVLSVFSAFELYVMHLSSIRVFINGIAFLEQQSFFPILLTPSATNDTDVMETSKREGIFSFIQSPLLTVAIEVFSNHPLNRTTDPFLSHMTFLSFSTPPSSRLSADSDHRKDFYAHPLSFAIDDNRSTAWWFRGNSAEVAFTFSNPL